MCVGADNWKTNLIINKTLLMMRPGLGWRDLAGEKVVPDIARQCEML